MENISSTDQLQAAIQILEVEQAVKLKLMKEQFHLAYESLKPVNLIKNTLKEISASPYLVNNLLNATIALLSGFVSKTAITGRSKNKFRRFLGILMQFGVTNIIAQNSKAIKSFGQYVSHRVFHGEEMDHASRDQ